MAKRRFYLDTSVWGCAFSLHVEFNMDTNMFFKMVMDEGIVCLYSEIVENELVGAPDDVRAYFNGWPDNLKEKVEITPDVLKLANMYIKEGVVGGTILNDCIHIAAATIHRADALVSWNFKHIVNMRKVEGYNSINIGLGYKMLGIYSPKEVINYED
jgi:hypothetical protein